MMKKTSLVIALVFFIVLFAVILFAKLNLTRYIPFINKKTPVVQQAQVSILSGGFLPATISVKAGTAVTFTNEDTTPHIVASEPYPSHSALPDFVSPALASNDSYTFIFEKKGTFTYQDDLHPLKFKGTIV